MEAGQWWVRGSKFCICSFIVARDVIALQFYNEGEGVGIGIVGVEFSTVVLTWALVWPMFFLCKHLNLVVNNTEGNLYGPTSK